MMAPNSHFGKWAVFYRISNRKVNFLAARKTSSTAAAESAPFGGLTRSGALLLARCVHLIMPSPL